MFYSTAVFFYYYKLKGTVWSFSLNNNFHILNNITHIFIHIFTHTYFKKFKKFKKTLNNNSQTILPNTPYSHTFFSSIANTFPVARIWFLFLSLIQFTLFQCLHSLFLILIHSHLFFNHNMTWFSDPNHSLNRKKKKIKIFEVESRFNKGWTVMT